MTQNCPCIDSNQILSSRVKENTSCPIINYGYYGFETIDPCFDPLYGSSKCIAHDLVFPETFSCDVADPPTFCDLPWCYVDYEKCRRSQIPIYRSDYFAGLYFSYDACNASAAAYKSGSTTEGLRGINLTVVIPGSTFPYHYKETPDGEIATYESSEYYNDSIPFQGSLINYARELQMRAGIEHIHFTFRTGPSKVPRSESLSWSVQDIQRGIGDMAIGMFSMTSGRMLQSSFTTPLLTDSIVLLIPRPKVDTTLYARAKTTLAPFSTDLWLVLALCFIVVGTLQIWYSNESGQFHRVWVFLRSKSFRESPWFTKVPMALYMMFETSWITFIAFFGGSVDPGLDELFPGKILQLGTAFLVLVSVSAYVANLVAFLGKPLVAFHYDSMDSVLKDNGRICANQVLKAELSTVWPTAQFVYYRTPFEMMEALDQGECDTIGLGKNTLRQNAAITMEMCKRDIVISPNAHVYNNPIGFPTRPNIAAGMSYHMKKADEEGFTFEHFQRNYQIDPPCDVELNLEFSEDELYSLTPIEMVFPLVTFVALIAASIVAKLCAKKKKVLIKSTSKLVRGEVSWRKISSSRKRVTKRKRSRQQPFRQRRKSKTKVAEGKEESDSHEKEEPLDDSSIEEIWGELLSSKFETERKHGKFTRTLDQHVALVATAPGVTEKSRSRIRKATQPKQPRATRLVDSETTAANQLHESRRRRALEEVVVWS